jgi:hypothetical protein
VTTKLKDGTSSQTLHTLPAPIKLLSLLKTRSDIFRVTISQADQKASTSGSH